MNIVKRAKERGRTPAKISSDVQQVQCETVPYAVKE